MGRGDKPGSEEELSLERGRSVGQSTVREVSCWARLQASRTILGDVYNGTPATVIRAEPMAGVRVEDVLGVPSVQAAATIAIVNTSASRRGSGGGLA
jgi:hypothetical protein